MNRTVYMISSFLMLTMIFLLSGRVHSEELNMLQNSRPVELGQVDWIRSFDEGAKLAKSRNKPLLVLFQEVPGCSTSSGYGKNVLSHPLIVEAIETLFVPVAIYNNKAGEDARVLRSFDEPSWNNPVVRIMTHERKELTPRLSGDYTKAGLVQAMITALKNADQSVPQYLSLLAREFNVKSGAKERAVFAMHCFWVGEGKLANINGVMSTKPGFMGGYEVVELEFNPDIVSYKDLLSRARSNNVASHVFTLNGEQSAVAKEIVGPSYVSELSAFRADSSPKYYLSRTLYKHVPMTSLQLARVNAAIGSLQSPDIYLSPRQLDLYRYIEEHKELNWPDAVRASNLNSSWDQALSLVRNQISRR